jgi:hypothetical protein
MGAASCGLRNGASYHRCRLKSGQIADARKGRTFGLFIATAAVQVDVVACCGHWRVFVSAITTLVT